MRFTNCFPRVPKSIGNADCKDKVQKQYQTKIDYFWRHEKIYCYKLTIPIYTISWIPQNFSPTSFTLNVISQDELLYVSISYTCCGNKGWIVWSITFRNQTIKHILSLIWMRLTKCKKQLMHKFINVQITFSNSSGFHLIEYLLIEHFC